MKRVGITINGVIRDYLSALDQKYKDIFDTDPNYPIDLYDLDNTYPVEEIDKGDTMDFDPNFEPEYEYNEKLDKYIPKNTPESFVYNDQSQRDEQRSIYYFMYYEAPIPIFARANFIENNIIEGLSHLQNQIEEKIILISKENQLSKNATLMFLCSDTQFDLNEIIFVDDYSEYWENVDMLVTDNPVIMDAKPEGKEVIKLNKDYNKNHSGDYNIDNPSDLIQYPNNYFKIKENAKE